jgi:hypothetical protein
MNNIKVEYTTEIITESKIIKPDTFSCISFQNIGEASAVLMDNIPLGSNDPVRNFKNEPGQIINCDFQVKFTEPGKERSVLIVKTYYKE